MRPNLANPGVSLMIFQQEALLNIQYILQCRYYHISFQDFYDQIIELARSDMDNIRKPFPTATNQCDLDSFAPENND